MGRRKAARPELSLIQGGGMPMVNPLGIASTIRMPDDEKVVVKEVPAKVDGTVVGVAQIYDDGTVGVVIDEDCPQWAKDKMQLEASMVGFSIGGLDGPA